MTKLEPAGSKLLIVTIGGAVGVCDGAVSSGGYRVEVAATSGTALAAILLSRKQCFGGWLIGDERMQDSGPQEG